MSAKHWATNYDPRTDESDDPDSPQFRPPRARSKRKDTVRWCKGKEGVEHVYEIRRWRPDWISDCRQRPSWAQWCFHEKYCTSCGKIIRFLDPSECPDLSRQ